VEDPTSNTPTTAIGSKTSKIDNQNTLITAESRRISTLQSNPTQRMAPSQDSLSPLSRRCPSVNPPTRHRFDGLLSAKYPEFRSFFSAFRLASDVLPATRHAGQHHRQP
jgi:hypothetical protein